MCLALKEFPAFPHKTHTRLYNKSADSTTREMDGMISLPPASSSAACTPLIDKYLGASSIAPLRRLDTTTSNRLQAETQITSHGQAVEELVLNAVDALATKIIIYLDVSRGDIVVEDNGRGVPPACMPQIGLP